MPGPNLIAKGANVLSAEYLPHIDLLLQALRVNRERLNSKSKIAIDAKLLRNLLQLVVLNMPFSAEFYAKTYPDLAEAHASGQIPDLHRHFIDSGFLEGRFGAPPPVDEAYYTALYRDVAIAVERGDVVSGAEHYMRSGAAEGRIPNAELKSTIDHWNGMLRDDARVSG
jgi:hypothetical protein